MTLAEFTILFERALEQAAEKAEETFQVQVPRTFKIELHGAGYSGSIVNKEEAAKAMYLGPDLFHRVIDVSVIRIRDGETTAFVRVAGYPPGPFAATWDQPPGSGPFKQQIAIQLK